MNQVKDLISRLREAIEKKPFKMVLKKQFRKKRAELLTPKKMRDGQDKLVILIVDVNLEIFWSGAIIKKSLHLMLLDPRGQKEVASHAEDVSRVDILKEQQHFVQMKEKK